MNRSTASSVVSIVPKPGRRSFPRNFGSPTAARLAGEPRKQSLDTTDVKEARKRRDKILHAVSDKREGKAPPVIRSWQDAVDGCHAHLEAKARAGEISPAASPGT
jgi:hypothetical protein